MSITKQTSKIASMFRMVTGRTADSMHGQDVERPEARSAGRVYAALAQSHNSQGPTILGLGR